MRFDDEIARAVKHQAAYERQTSKQRKRQKIFLVQQRQQ